MLPFSRRHAAFAKSNPRRARRRLRGGYHPRRERGHHEREPEENHIDADKETDRPVGRARPALPAGLLQATVLSTRDANYGIGRAIAPDTFVIDQVERKGHLHCYCDAVTLVGLLAGFDLLTLSQQLQERRPGSHHWHIIAERRG